MAPSDAEDVEHDCSFFSSSIPGLSTSHIFSTFAASVEDFAKQESERERDIYLAARDRREPHPNHVPAISDAKLQANGFVPQELVAVCEVIPVSESDHAHPLGPGGIGGLPYRQL